MENFGFEPDFDSDIDIDILGSGLDLCSDLIRTFLDLKKKKKHI